MGVDWCADDRKWWTVQCPFLVLLSRLLGGLSFDQVERMIAISHVKQASLRIRRAVREDVCVWGPPACLTLTRIETLFRLFLDPSLSIASKQTVFRVRHQGHARTHTILFECIKREDWSGSVIHARLDCLSGCLTRTVRSLGVWSHDASYLGHARLRVRPSRFSPQGDSKGKSVRISLHEWNTRGPGQGHVPT